MYEISLKILCLGLPFSPFTLTKATLYTKTLVWREEKNTTHKVFTFFIHICILLIVVGFVHGRDSLSKPYGYVLLCKLMWWRRECAVLVERNGY